ncbi:tripartite tricarboxylate transporter substrate binding protein [Bordetella petrii]|nr:tripartite tricarboxylate transporter substrate binding protein [Bordetella petrii]
MNTPLRKFCAAVSLLFFACGGAAAAGYPTKPVRLIVPYAAGGSTDSTARLVAKALAERLGQPFVVENRAGAGGMIGQDVIAKAPADGYMLLFSAAGPLTVTPHAYPKLPYDAIGSFTPIKLVAQSPLVLVANPKTGLKTVQDLVKAARAQPGTLTYASFGNGSAAHLAGELFKSIEHVDIVHVPYKGSAPGLVDVISGQVDVMFDVLVSALPHVQNGSLVPLAITLGSRSPLMPEVPTMQEAGVHGFEAGTWFALLGPRGLPDEVVARLSAALDETLKTPEFQQAMIAQGAEVASGTPQSFARFFQAQYDKWGKVAQMAGIKAQ